MKVGILTYHRAINYGAYLQACALCGRLNEEPDISAEIIDFHMIREARKYAYQWSLPARVRHFRKYRFLRTKKQAFERALDDPVMIRSAQYCCSDSMDDFTAFVRGRYDAVVAGSDEIWNFNNFRGFPNPYWLIGDLGCRKLSYAASSRQDFSVLPEEHLRLIRETLEEYDFIGVRDDITAKELHRIVPGKEIHLCCDPSFLYDFHRGKKDMRDLMAGKKGFDPSRPSAVVMSDNAALNRYLYSRLNRTHNLISVTSYNHHYINTPDILPVEWMDIIQNADLVFTTYFHGTCFALIGGTPFLSFSSSARGSKVSTLLLQNGFETNYIADADAFVREDGLARSLRDLTDAEDPAAFQIKCSRYVGGCRTAFENIFMKTLRG